MRRGRRHSDYFGSAVWGGRALALLAAQRRRDELLLRIEPDTRERRRIPQGRRSKTGLVGVSLETHVVGRRTYRRYVARWQDEETGLHRRRFQVEHHGKDRALALAIRARKQGVAQRRASMLARQHEEAAERLRKAAPMPRQVKHPLSRKGISMARRRPRRAK